MLDLLNTSAPSKNQVEASLKGFVHRVQRALYRWDVHTLEIDSELLRKARRHALQLLWSYKEPSCFKAASALTLGLVSAAPFKVELPVRFGPLKDMPNALFGVLESVYWMHGAELRMRDGTVRTLSNQIEFSDHFFDEFIEVAASLGWPTPLPANDFSKAYHYDFRVLALTFEALAYQKNGHCKYDPPVSLQLDKYFSTLET